MTIILKKSKTSQLTDIELDFIDEESGDKIGKFEYSLNKQDKSAFIDLVYIQPDFRKGGILKSKLDDLLCNMKCEGANVVKLRAITDEAKSVWSKLGFNKKSEELKDNYIAWNMEKKLDNIKCDCILKKK